MTLRCSDAVIASAVVGASSECDACNRPGHRPSRWYAIVVGFAVWTYLHDDIAWADPLDEPWRIARADPLSRLRSVELSRRRGGLWAIVRARLEGDRGLSEVDRSAEDEALLSLLAQEPDLSARLTALTALALPLGRDTRSLAARVEALRLPELAPPALALAALHAVGSTESLLDAARARGSVVPDDELAAVALDALATRQYAELEGRTVEEPLLWRIQARRRDPGAAAAIVAELVRASVEIRGGRGMSAIRAARELRLTEASAALLEIARSGPERELRRQAVEALGDLGGVADEALAALLDDPVTRGPALGAVARLRALGAVAAVRRCLQLDDPGDRRSAEEALASLRGEAAPAPAEEVTTTEGRSPAALRRALLTEADEGVRLRAAMALAGLEGSGALPALEAARAVAWSRRLLDGLSLAAAAARASAEP